MMSVSTQVDRRGEGSPIKRTSLRPYLVVSAPSARVLNVCEAKNVLLQVRNEERMHEMHSFDGGVCENVRGRPGIEIFRWIRSCVAMDSNSTFFRQTEMQRVPGRQFSSNFPITEYLQK